MNYNGKEAEFEIERRTKLIKDKDDQIKKLTEALAMVNQCYQLASQDNPFYGKFRALLAEIKG